MDTVIEVCNYISGAIFTAMWIPQIYTAYKTKSTRDLNILMLIANKIALILFLTYGAYHNILSIYIPASCGIVLGTALLIMKIVYDRKTPDTCELVEV